jgi:hypothetical protein
LFRDGGQMDSDGEHIDIGGHAGGANRFGALEVRLSRLQRLLGGPQAVGGEHRAIVRLDYAGDDLHADLPLVFKRHLAREIGRSHGVARLPGIVNRLVDGEDGLEVVERTGAVQRPDVEVVGAELMLCQQ